MGLVVTSPRELHPSALSHTPFYLVPHNFPVKNLRQDLLSLVARGREQDSLTEWSVLKVVTCVHASHPPHFCH